MKTAFHGTTADILKQILKDGKLSTSPEKRNWNESNNAVYLWANFNSENDEEERRQECLSRATDNAEIPLIDSQDCRRVVLEIDVEGLNYDNDGSCDNMEGAIECFDEIPVSRIVNVWVDREELSPFKTIIIKNLLKHSLFDFSNSPTISKLSDYMRKQIEKMEVECYWQEEFQVEECLDWKKIFGAWLLIQILLHSEYEIQSYLPFSRWYGPNALGNCQR